MLNDRNDNPVQPQTVSQVAPSLWYSSATHDGGKPISHYIGDFRNALAEGLKYQHRYGGSLHIAEVKP